MYLFLSLKFRLLVNVKSIIITQDKAGWNIYAKQGKVRTDEKIFTKHHGGKIRKPKKSEEKIFVWGDIHPNARPSGGGGVLSVKIVYLKVCYFK